MQIPLNDLSLHHASIKEELISAFQNALDTSSFVGGPTVSDFENSFADAVSAKYCASCANGTDALFLSVKSLGVKPGDEVLVPAHSWFSTSEAVSLAGAKPVFVDTSKVDCLINTNLIEAAITSKTVGIIPVHIFGHPVDMKSIKAIAEKHKLWIIEDCAQAHLASIDNQPVGTFGDIGCFSFYPGKNLGALGDAGAVVTNDRDLYLKIKMLSCHGGLVKHEHLIEGTNSRLDSLQAAFLLVKLKYLAKWTERRISIAEKYISELSSLSALTLPEIKNSYKHVFHLFVVKTTQRNELSQFLKDNNIATGVNYPVALPFLPAYKHRGFQPHHFPQAFSDQNQILTLPLYPELTDQQIKTIISALKMFFA